MNRLRATYLGDGASIWMRRSPVGAELDKRCRTGSR
jgi:hypothetical protein